MKSRLFRSTELRDDIVETVQRGVRALIGVPVGVGQRLLDDLPTFIALQERTARFDFIDRQLSDLEIERADANAIVALGQIVMNGHLEERTRDLSADAIVADLQDLAGVDESSGPLLTSFVDHAIATSPRFRDARERVDLARGVLPSLASFGTTVELRAMIEREFRPGDAVDAYAPRVVGWIPIASVRLRSDEDEVFSFQSDRAGLAALVDQLRATLKELDVLEGVKP